MKLQAHSLFTIRVNNPVGRRALWSIILIVRSAVISIFLWVVAFNEGRPFFGEQFFTRTARVLAYPVYQI